MLFVKAAKIFAASLTLTPLAGCAVATGIVFGSLMQATSNAPDNRNLFFSNALLAFALIETFCFFALGLAAYLLFL